MDSQSLKELIESSDKPILVDFWADWCGPCKMLKPILEKLHDEAHGEWRLIKIDTQMFPETAAEYQVRGIPDVRLFWKGKQIEGFTGAMGEFELRKWMEQHIPTERGEQFSSIQQLLLSNPDEGLKQLVDFVQKYPEFEEAKILFAKQMLYLDPDQSLEITENIKKSSPHYQQAQAVHDLAELFLFNNFQQGTSWDYLKKFKENLMQQQMDQAIENLIQCVSINKSLANELPKRAGIALFNLLGEKHELSQQYLRKFRLAVY